MNKRNRGNSASRVCKLLDDRHIVAFPRLHLQKRRNELQAVLDPMVDFPHQEILLLEQFILLFQGLLQFLIEPCNTLTLKAFGYHTANTVDRIYMVVIPYV